MVWIETGKNLENREISVGLRHRGRVYIYSWVVWINRHRQVLSSGSKWGLNPAHVLLDNPYALRQLCMPRGRHTFHRVSLPFIKDRGEDSVNKG